MRDLSENWPFSDPSNVAVITLQKILDGGEPILLVSHDEEDGMWHFLTGEQAGESDARIVGLLYMTQLDPTVIELADLPFGWQAWRSKLSDPWQRSETSFDNAGWQ